MIEKCIEIVKDGDYDFATFKMHVAEHVPCSITQADFSLILDMALKNLKQKARNAPLETFIEFDFDKKKKKVPKNVVPITIFQDRKEQFSK